MKTGCDQAVILNRYDTGARNCRKVSRTAVMKAGCILQYVYRPLLTSQAAVC